jgi:DNA-binding response OmpR family regulator
MKILVVDDDSDIRSFLSEKLKSSGYEVAIASSGQMAIEILRREIFNLIISDFRMPGGDGLSILNYVSNMQKKPKFFLISADISWVISSILPKNVDFYLEKPFNIQSLMNEIRSIKL